ncbi:hypothetical protein [Shinella zoogloeoides]|uniref:hypothetical protein n=1 Tax=Shinella zoogloeoides TaxID=352475 RepID=UPI0028A9EDFA|nr:hypothetical protein [Shinella zoogloeoides]
MIRYLSAAAVVLAAAHAVAADPAYRDDRSDAASLIRSLYNAIDRKEYARAWDYFGDRKPAADFAAFAEGYAGTEAVDVALGAVSEEGAAGSVYFQVPLAIRAHRADGRDEVFAGCYVVRQVNPAIQEPPFRPLQIEKGNLKPATANNLDEAVPAECGE